MEWMQKYTSPIIIKKKSEEIHVLFLASCRGCMNLAPQLIEKLKP